MRHRHGYRKLNITDGAHRRAMMRHIGNALITHEQAAPEINENLIVEYYFK